MPDYSLGRAHGKIDISYDGSGADQAAAGIEKVAVEADKLDASLDKSQASLRDTEKEFDKAGTSADNYSKRVHSVDSAHTKLHGSHQQTGRDLDDFATKSDKAEQSSSKLSKALKDAGEAVEVFAPEAEEGSAALEDLSKHFDKAGASAAASGEHVRDFVKHLADFEAGFAKISGITLAIPSLGGLAGLAGGAALQGLVAMGDAVRQLSGALGVLPAAIAGVGMSMATLKVAFHGVGAALKDMMSDDPKKFLEDLKNLSPAAAQAMLQVAQFRDAFKLAGAAVQDSFFSKIVADITPLIQTLLPAVTAGMTRIAGIFGTAADALAKGLMTPQAMADFKMFIDNLSKGLQSLLPAIQPLVNIFAQLAVVGSGFFAQIGQDITKVLGFFDQLIQKATASGTLQQWIQNGINAFNQLINIVYHVGSAFNTIFDAAEKFGGGGFLGWLEEITKQFDAWTKSVGGQNTLQTFFRTTQQAMQAFAPMIKPIADGFGALFAAFTKLGVGIAPGWQVFFNTFAKSMQQLGPQIVAMAPALNGFLGGLATAMSQLMAQVGPQLPQIFQTLAVAFDALIPQLKPLVNAFLQLVSAVGPQLPTLFGSVTNAIVSLTPYLPIIIGLIRDFVSVLGVLARSVATAVNELAGFARTIQSMGIVVGAELGKVKDAIGNVFRDLKKDAAQWGKDLINGFIDGIKSMTAPLTSVLKTIGDHIPSVVKKALGISSPSTVFRDIGVNTMVGLQQGLAAASVPVVNQTLSIARAVTGAMSSGLAGAGASGGGVGGGAPAAGGAGTEGATILPPWIASADTSGLDAYLHHQFDDKRGLKGLATNLGRDLQAIQNGFQLIQSYLQIGTQAAQLFAKQGSGANQQTWQKLSDNALIAQQKKDLQSKALQDAAQPASWQQVTGPGAIPGLLQSVLPALGLTSASSAQDIQKAIISAGKARGLGDADIQTALAVAAAESGFDPSANGGVQGSAGQVLGLFQQSPSSGWGTPAQVLDPNYAINAFYNAFQQRLAQNPGNPLLAAVLAQNPQLGASAQNSKYMNDIADKLLGAGNILQALGPSVTGLPPQIVPPGIAPPAAAATPSGAQIAENPASRATQVPSAPNVEAGIRAIGGLPTLYPTSGPGAYQVPAWADQLAQDFGLSASTYASGGSLHQMGFAFDFNGPAAGREALAQFISQNLAQQTLQLIYRGSSQDYGIASGQVTPPSYYAGDLAGHTDHVHWATDVAPIMGAQAGQPVPVGAQAGQPVPVKDDPLTQAYLRGNPQLAQQIAAAQAPGATNQQITDALTGIDTSINGLKAQDAAGNANTISALQNTQQTIASSQGYAKGSSSGGGGSSAFSSVLGAASSIGSGVYGAVTSAISTVNAGFTALGATQDITDRLVYGIANTGDVMKLVDDAQTYIAFASSVASTVGNVLTTIGGVVNSIGQIADVAGDAAAIGTGDLPADPGAGVTAAVQGISAVGQGINLAGSVAQGVAGVLTAVNATIDYAQEVYNIATGYAGQFLSFLTSGGPGGTQLMGDVRYLLDTNTGQLLTYSEDNALNKNALQIPSFFQGAYGYGAYGPTGGAEPNPQVNQQLNIYAGPGQSPAQMMNQTMWLVNTGGTTGAMAPANF